MSSFARENNSNKASIYTEKLYASGAFKNVFRGRYTHGTRAGQECVCKIFKTGSVFEESYFQVDLAVAKKALEIVNSFNDAKIVSSQTRIWLNKPEVWMFESRNSRNGEKNIIEPMIRNFEKFNSNTGWTPNEKSSWIDVMQALSHYSYHSSNGSLLICDLQGGIYRDGFILTDPVIMSATREYGPTDLGLEGFSTFFALHKCNKFCQPNWRVPQEKKMFYKIEKGTTMELSTCHSNISRPRPQLPTKVEDSRFKVPFKPGFRRNRLNPYSRMPNKVNDFHATVSIKQEP